MPNDRLVFVYGTLKRNQSNHGALNGANFKGYGLTVAKFKMWGNGFPLTCFDDTNGAPVSGEVYRVDKNIMDRLDCLEGFPNFYDRVMTAVHLHDETETRAWMYFIPIKRAMDQYNLVHQNQYPPDSEGVLQWPFCRELSIIAKEKERALAASHKRIDVC